MLKKTFFSITEDWKVTGLNKSTAIFNTAFRAVLAFRIYSYIYCNISKYIGYFLYQRAIKKYSVDIAPTAQIGFGFRISHTGAIVIGRNAKIGNKVTINSGVTIGMRSSIDHSMPSCGNHVNIGTGAKLIGGIHIGNYVIIGANAVVISDIEDKSIVVGIPASITKKIND